jgi:hypothetical protein
MTLSFFFTLAQRLIDSSFASFLFFFLFFTAFFFFFLRIFISNGRILVTHPHPPTPFSYPPTRPPGGVTFQGLIWSESKIQNDETEGFFFVVVVKPHFLLFQKDFWLSKKKKHKNKNKKK